MIITAIESPVVGDSLARATPPSWSDLRDYFADTRIEEKFAFSAQKAIHSKTRNRLLSERVRKLMFVRWNLRLLVGFGPEVADAVDELAAAIDEVN